MRSSTATRSEVAALSGDAGAEVPATRGDAGAGSAGGMARRGAGEGSARARFCKRRRCSAPLICCAERSSRLIQVRPRARAGPGRGQGGARAGPGRGQGRAGSALTTAGAGCLRPRPRCPAPSPEARPPDRRPSGCAFARSPAARAGLPVASPVARRAAAGELRG